MDSSSSGAGMSINELPYSNELIPVRNGVDEFISFVDMHPSFSFCPYIADKTLDEWLASTSRRYMNQLLPNFLYVPVNIDDGSDNSVASLIRFAEENSQIAAVNITKPHKSSRVLKQYFYSDPESPLNVDTLIKSSTDGRLYPYDLNAPAFISWYEEEVGSFEGMNVVIVGAGGVGEPVAKHIDHKNPSSITLVDVQDRTKLAKLLQSRAHYYDKLDQLTEVGDRLVVINASGKDGISDDTGLYDFLAQQKPGVFIDLRPQLKIEIVERVAELGWKSYTGNGMNERNDYELLKGIMDYLDVSEPERPSFAEFSIKVKKAS